MTGPFSDRKKAALRYADQMYDDHHKVDDARFAELRTHFTDDEILELSWAIGEFISLGKIIYVLSLPYGEGDTPAAVGLAGDEGPPS